MNNIYINFCYELMAVSVDSIINHNTVERYKVIKFLVLYQMKALIVRSSMKLESHTCLFPFYGYGCFCSYHC